MQTEVDTKRLVVGLALVFALGVLFAVVNGWYTSQTNEQLPLIVYSISFLSVLIGAFIVLVFQWKLTQRQVQQMLRVLPREERLVLQELLRNKNALEQNKLVVLSGLSKVQVSRVTDKLVERGVLEKKQMGNTKLVVLKL